MRAGRKKGEIFYRLYQSTELYNMMKESTPETIRTGEIRLFWLICGLLEDFEVITSKQIVYLNKEINGYKEGSTRTTLQNLRNSELIVTHRETNQYFSQSYISITDKGNVLKALIRDKVYFNPLAILDKLDKEQAIKKKKARQKAGKTLKEKFKQYRKEGKPVNQHPPKK